MKCINNLWIRIILSLFIGGLLAELGSFQFDVTSSFLSNAILIVGASIVFVYFSVPVWKNKSKGCEIPLEQ